MYFIRGGEVEVFLSLADGPVATIGAGRIIGEEALLTSAPRSAWVRAKGRVMVYVLGQAGLQLVFEEFSGLEDLLRAPANSRRQREQQAQLERMEAEASAAEAEAAAAEEAAAKATRYEETDTETEEEEDQQEEQQQEEEEDQEVGNEEEGEEFLQVDLEEATPEPEREPVPDWEPQLELEPEEPDTAAEKVVPVLLEPAPASCTAVEVSGFAPPLQHLNGIYHASEAAGLLYASSTRSLDPNQAAHLFHRHHGWMFDDAAGSWAAAEMNCKAYRDGGEGLPVGSHDWFVFIYDADDWQPVKLTLAAREVREPVLSPPPTSKPPLEEEAEEAEEEIDFRLEMADSDSEFEVDHRSVTTYGVGGSDEEEWVEARRDSSPPSKSPVTPLELESPKGPVSHADLEVAEVQHSWLVHTHAKEVSQIWGDIGSHHEHLHSTIVGLEGEIAVVVQRLAGREQHECKHHNHKHDIDADIAALGELEELHASLVQEEGKLKSQAQTEAAEAEAEANQLLAASARRLKALHRLRAANGLKLDDE